MFVLRFCLLSLALAARRDPGPAATMRAMVVPRASPDETLHLEEMAVQARPLPTLVPGSGHMLVRTAASSVNPCDWKMLEGAFAQNYTYPHIPGYDVAGTVAAVDGSSEACAHARAGDTVWGMSFTRDPASGDVWSVGAYAEFTLMDCAHAGAAPPSLSSEEAAVLPLVGLTSLQALRVAARSRTPYISYSTAPAPAPAPVAAALANKTVLVLGGSGGTGHVAIQLARAMGAARIVATCGADNLDFVRSMGADEALDFRRQNWYDVGVLEAGSVDVIYDCVAVPGTGDHALATGAAGGVLRQGGSFVTLGSHALPGPAAVAARPDALHQFVLMNQTTTADLDTLAGLVEARKLRGVVMAQYALAGVPSAFNASQHGHVGGRELYGKLGITVQ